jgi:hypothetical protein
LFCMPPPLPHAQTNQLSNTYIKKHLEVVCAVHILTRM